MSIQARDYLAQQTEQYVRQVRRYYAAAENERLAELHASMSQRCTECGVHALVMSAEQRDAHVLIEDAFGELWVIVGCEGYWLVDPALVGMDRGAWQDWRADRCDGCAALMAQHCNECQECLYTPGPCWCGSWSYDTATVAAAAEFRASLAASADEHERSEAALREQEAARRQELAVNAAVAEVMAEQPGTRYAKAYGVLSGRVLSVEPSALPWARAFIAALDEAMRTGLTSERSAAAERIAKL